MRGLLLVLLLLARTASGQLSPGKLARAHQELEGLGNCTQCHELGKPVDGARCLACHKTLDARIRAGKGLHASPRIKGKPCVACHSDHHGRDFQLVFWEKGDKAFRHAETGWELEGAHSSTKCRDCHRPELLGASFRQRTDMDARSTYLGLSGECAACHRDEHQGQLGDDCASCHDARSWSRTSFNHERSRFPLSGAHRTAACGGCHPAELPRAKPAGFRVEGAATTPATRYKPLAFTRCVDCHADPHAGRFGLDCASCHGTAHWREAQDGFDHQRTRYPLTGAHAAVECGACHKGKGASRSRPPHEDCAPCHADAHAGQFAREPKAACSACHATERFKPSTFGLERHQAGRIPLEGAHQAVACADCHKPGRPGAPARFRMEGRGFSGQACIDCHQDAHAGQQASWAQEKGCRECHGLEDWSVRGFDHDRTSFPLAGRHRDAACGSCHRAEGTPAVPLSGLAQRCAGCHKDPHRGQFDPPGEAADCAACHREEGWNLPGFDHGRSRFPLDGRHRDLACAACHATESDGLGPFVRYKPLGIRCEDCHAPAGKESP